MNSNDDNSLEKNINDVDLIRIVTDISIKSARCFISLHSIISNMPGYEEAVEKKGEDMQRFIKSMNEMLDIISRLKGLKDAE